MIRKISSGELRPGMYITDINMSWVNTPFLSHNFIATEKDIEKIKKLDVQEIFIDTIRGVDTDEAEQKQLPPCIPVPKTESPSPPRPQAADTEAGQTEKEAPIQPRPDDSPVIYGLLVEDNKAQRKHILRILTGIFNGMEYDEAENGMEAITLLSKKRYDIVITDLTMPYVDGIKLIHFIRNQSDIKKTPVVVISAINTSGDIQKVAVNNISGYIIKPPNEELILKTMSPILTNILNNKKSK